MWVSELILWASEYIPLYFGCLNLYFGCLNAYSPDEGIATCYIYIYAQTLQTRIHARCVRILVGMLTTRAMHICRIVHIHLNICHGA